VAEDFIVGFSNSDSSPAGRREPVRVLVIGSSEGVTDVVMELYRRGFAEVNAWSRLQPMPRTTAAITPNPGEVMSILTRYRVER
jgi:hypothetical protein